MFLCACKTRKIQARDLRTHTQRRNGVVIEMRIGARGNSYEVFFLLEL